MDSTKPFDLKAAVIGRLVADTNLGAPMRRVLAEQHMKQAPRRFASEPVPMTDFGGFHDLDSSEQERMDEARREAADEMSERIENLAPWSRL